MTARCPVSGLAVSTSYAKGCRCEACKRFNSARSDARRRRVGARIQIRKLPGTSLCPASGKAAITSYQQGCKCATCREANRMAARARRAKKRQAEGRPLSDREIEARYGDAFKVFLQAMADDPEYLISMAEDAAAAVELRNSRIGVSGNAH